MYRPQFSNPKPPQGTYDEDFVYSFDPYNTPALNVRFAPGQQLLRVPLQMQSDAAFIHRGLKMNPSFTSFLGVQLFCPDDSPLSDDILPLSAYSANTGNPAPILEPEILSPAGASYQLNVVNRSATQSAMPIVATMNPVFIDAADQSEAPGRSGTVGTGIPVVYNGALYMPLVPNVNFSTMQIFKSLDGGKTWVQIGQASTPPGTNAAVVFDGNHSFIVAFSTLNTTATGALNLMNFDLATESWGAAYGTAGAPATQNVYGVYLRSDGSIIVIHNPRTSSGVLGTGSGLFAAVFAAGVWATNFDAGTGIAALPGYDVTQDFTNWAAAVVNPATGKLYVFFSTTGALGPPNWDGRVFFQLINLNNSLGTFFDFPGNDGAGTPQIFSVRSSVPVLTANQVVLGIVQAGGTGGGPDDFVTLLVGTGLNAPTFVYAPAPGIDPDYFDNVPVDGSTAPYLLFDGQTLFALYVATSSLTINGNELRLCYTNAADVSAGWAAVTIFNAANFPGPFNSVNQELEIPMLSFYGGSIFVTALANTVAVGSAQAVAFMGSITVEPIRIQLRGVKRYVRTKRTQLCATNK